MINLYTWYILGTWLIITIIHELGHAIGFYLVTKKFFRIHPKWYGFCVGTEEDIKEMNAKQKFIGTYTGVVGGLIPLLFFYPYDNLNLAILAYTFLCSMDILGMYYIFMMKPEYRDVKLKYFVDAMKIGNKLHEVKIFR